MSDEFRTWPENIQPTAEQLAEWFTKAPLEQRVQMSQRAIDASNEACRCIAADHEAGMEELFRLREEQMRRLAKPTAEQWDAYASSVRDMPTPYRQEQP